MTMLASQTQVVRDGSMKVRIYENLRTVSYAPFYIAETLGLYAKHGLQAHTVMSPSPTETAIGLMEGRIDVSFGGPMRVMMHHDQDASCPLLCFCQVVGPDPFMLIGRSPNTDFRFADLIGPTVGVMEDVPTPWLTLQDDMARAGCDPAALVRGPHRSMADNVEALICGDVDVIQVMEPFAELALSQAGTHLWHQFSTRGNVGFTSFYTTRGYFEGNDAECAALTQAVMEAVGRIYADDARDIAKLIAPLFPDFTPELLTNAIERYKQARIWTTDPRLNASEFVRLKAALLSGGFISKDVSFAVAVDNRHAPGHKKN